MNLLFFFFFLGACFLGLTNAKSLTPEEKQRVDECLKNCKHDEKTCYKKCDCEVFHNQCDE
ncbi:unnamed protein product [Cylicocyclus nassatus]|uniref:Uncharacterized protein n=1 Tax=Cylicocyclus nassatus TaxID=53992 RepID=A0AA36M449_CYLNA|nr:unnamed protein product [Cylicocyclus nassatus]